MKIPVSVSYDRKTGAEIGRVEMEVPDELYAEYLYEAALRCMIPAEQRMAKKAAAINRDREPRQRETIAEERSVAT